MSPRPQRVAAIDVGSNTILLLIAEHTPSAALAVVAEAEDQPRLGAGLAATGQLSDTAMERAIESLTRMRELCLEHRVDRISAAATAAVREAGNGEEFARRVRELGIPLRILSPEMEAGLAYRSASYAFPHERRILVADIGGGSLELVGARDGRIELTQSLPLGSVRLTELSVPLTELRRRIGSQLSGVLPGNEWAGSRVIGSGGTFATLAAMVLAEQGFRPDHPIQGLEVSRTGLERTLVHLNGLSPELRRHVPGLQPRRADIIVAGLAVVAELLQRVGAEAVTVSALGLRWGMVLEMVES